MCICVGTMEGFCGRGYCSSEDIVTRLSASEDELDIVGEATMDDIAEEDHLGLPALSVPFSPIVECAGLSRASWVNLEVILINDNGVVVAEGICRNTHPQHCIDEKPTWHRGCWGCHIRVTHSFCG